MPIRVEEEDGEEFYSACESDGEDQNVCVHSQGTKIIRHGYSPSSLTTFAKDENGDCRGGQDRARSCGTRVARKVANRVASKMASDQGELTTGDAYSQCELEQRIQQQLSDVGVKYFIKDEKRTTVAVIARVWVNWYKKVRKFYRGAIPLLRVEGPWWRSNYASREPTREAILPTLEESLHLYRFAIARQNEYNEIVKMLENDLEWRENLENNVLKINVFQPDLERRIKQLYPHGYFGTDLMGRPVYYDCIGRSSLKRLFKQCNTSQLVRYWTYMYEHVQTEVLMCCSIAAKKKIYQGVTVIDLKDISGQHLGSDSRELFCALMKISSEHYPENMARTFILNGGWVFRAIWAFVKTTLSPDTLRKIIVVPIGKEHKILQEHIRIDQIPPFILQRTGSAAEDPLPDWITRPIGPWVSDEMRAIARSYIDSS